MDPEKRKEKSKKENKKWSGDMDPEKKKTQSRKEKNARRLQLGEVTFKEVHRAQNRKYVARIEEMRKKAQNRMYKQAERDKMKCADATTRRRRFQLAVLRGPNYVCSCCHQMLYRNSATEVTDQFREKVKNVKEHVYPWFQQFEQKLSDGKYCSTCKSSIIAGRMPAMAVANGLDLREMPEECKLTELENNLIAQNINFQKIVLLQKSRWAAGKGRMVSVPVGPQDIMNAVKTLPRLPCEAGLIPIKLKRKKEYKGHEKSELIRPEKLFQALRYLREKGHPYY
jgi:hypothetical protein